LAKDIICILTGLSIAALICIQTAQAATPIKGLVKGHGTLDGTFYGVYTPDGLQPGVKYPCVFAISPDGTVIRSLRHLKVACDKYHWIMISPMIRDGSKKYHEMDDMMEDAMQSAIKNYAIDPKRIVVVGYDSGATEAHHLSAAFPELVAGVIADAGIIDEAQFKNPSYPTEKMAVFMTDPSDERYEQMQVNAKFLKTKNWKLTYVKTRVGHQWASPANFTKAVGWFDQQFGGITNTPGAPKHDENHGFAL
jgi:predicted esterase